MKRILLSLVCITTISLSSLGQAPEGFNYQAVVRNASNTIVNNQSVGMRMTIQQGSIGGTTVYSETFGTTTNAYGLVNLKIGSGTSTDDFSAIDWSAGPFFMETAIDLTGGTNYAVMGTSQLMSVPYALYAKTSGNGQGPVGPQGIQGPAGVDGTNGTDGAVGATGPAGPQGIQGPTGATGLTGAQGIQGIQGTPGSQDAWGLNGNAGTNASANFIGTTGAQDVVFRTNNIERMRLSSNGNLGIGTTSIPVPLTFNGGAGDRISFFYTSPTSLYGLGIQNQLLQMYTNGSSSDIAFGYGSSGSFNENFRIKGNGNVGVGTNNPSFKFQISSATGGLFFDPNQPNFNRMKSTASETGIGRDLLLNAGGNGGLSPDLYIKTNGNIGIGNSNPTEKLHINSDLIGLDSSFIITNSGRVGMGMNPTMRLDVWPSGTITDQQVMRVTGYVLDNPSSPPIAAIRGGGDGASVFEISKPSGPARNYAQLRMGVDGTLGSIYSNGGNFGVNINNPARSLHIKDVMRLEPIPTAPASPAKGDIYFDSTLNKLRVYDGTTWQNCW